MAAGGADIGFYVRDPGSQSYTERVARPLVLQRVCGPSFKFALFHSTS
jgi:hypothetical protein